MLSDPLTPPPVVSVVLPAYRPRSSIVSTLRALRHQAFNEPYEVIVVESGPSSCHGLLVQEFPEVRALRFTERLLPGSARNAGVKAARGTYIAFCSDDTPPVPNWLATRVELHRRGFDAVAGSIANGTPDSLVGTAGYLLEYSAVMPDERVLRDQRVPHALSFHRSV